MLGLRGLACFYGTDVITLVFRTLPDRSEDLRYPSTFGWPSPAVSPNSWMAEISAAVQPNGSTGGLLNNNLNNFSQEGCSDTIPKNIFGKDTSDEEKGRLMLAKLTTYPNLRRSLHSLNIARAYKYGSRSFGEKGWYTENFNIGKKLRTNDDRRKFRFGLKSNVDFLLQLDLENLKSCLIEKVDVTSFPPNDRTSSLSDGSFLNLMQKLNQTKARDFCKIINRLESNLKFTQSLSEHFATDDMLEPALMVISDGLRKSPDLGEGLWGRSVAGNALLYRHRASSQDHELKSRRLRYQTDRSPPRTPTRRPRGRIVSGRTPYRSYFTPEYPKGTCFRFQKTGKCESKECPYDHECCKCFSKSHGRDTCPDNL